MISIAHASRRSASTLRLSYIGRTERSVTVTATETIRTLPKIIITKESIFLSQDREPSPAPTFVFRPRELHHQSSVTQTGAAPAIVWRMTTAIGRKKCVGCFSDGNTQSGAGISTSSRRNGFYPSCVWSRAPRSQTSKDRKIGGVSQNTIAECDSLMYFWQLSVNPSVADTAKFSHLLMTTLLRWLRQTKERSTLA